MSVVYIVFARFDKLLFDRRERYVRPIAKLMKSITEKLELHIASLLNEIKNMSTAISLSSTFKMLCFTVAAVIIIIGSAVYLFLSVIRKLFFNLLIGWKALSLGSLGIMFNQQVFWCSRAACRCSAHSIFPVAHTSVPFHVDV